MLRQAAGFYEQAVALDIKWRGQEPFDRLVVEISNADIDGEIGKPADDLLGTVREHRKVDVRMQGADLLGQQRNHRQRGGNSAEHNASLEARLVILEVAEFLLHRLPALEDDLRPLEHALALGRQPAVALAALDDGNFQLQFELTDAARQRRLGHVARRRRASEMLLAS